MSSVFTAQFRGGKCPECGDPIEAGDDVSYLDGELLHASHNFTSFYGDDWGFSGVWDDDDEGEFSVHYQGD